VAGKPASCVPDARSRCQPERHEPSVPKSASISIARVIKAGELLSQISGRDPCRTHRELTAIFLLEMGSNSCP
jgi:hypothetical protein